MKWMARGARGRLDKISFLLSQAASRSGSDRRRLLERARVQVDRVGRKLLSSNEPRATSLRFETAGLEALVARELGDPEWALALLMPAVSWQLGKGIGFQAETGRLTMEMAVCYRQLAMPDRAADFMREYMARTPGSLLSVNSRIFCLATLLDTWELVERSDDIGECAKIKDEIKAHVQVLRATTESVLSRDVILLVEQWLGAGSSQSTEILASAERMLAVVPDQADTWCYVAAFALAQAKQTAEARNLLKTAALFMQKRGEDPWRTARLRQIQAVLTLAESPQEALDVALETWVVMDDLRYKIQSARVRTALFNFYAPTRRVAMQAASALGDYRTLTELIESARLQTSAHMAGRSGDLTALSELPDEHEGNQRTVFPPDSAQEVEVDGRVEIPRPYCYPYEDSMGSQGMALREPADVYVEGSSALARTRKRLAPHLTYRPAPRRRLDAERIIASVCSDRAVLWFAMWAEQGRFFWALSHDGIREGGVMRAEAITPPGVPSGTDLLVCDSAIEREVTTRLGGLLPEAVRQPTGGGPRPLMLSVAASLAFVPWPILRLADGQSRLMDAFELRFLPSLSSLEAVNPVARPTAGQLPLLLSCDYFPEDRTPRPPRPAKTCLGSHAQVAAHPGVRPATSISLLRWLQSTHPGVWGLTVFRGHYQSVLDVPPGQQLASSRANEDPNRSGILLIDEVLPSALLTARNSVTGAPMFGLSSHVLLGCCRSAGTSGNGGEALGLTAACLHAGARHVIATAIDIPACPYVDNLLDRLTEAIGNPGSSSHFWAVNQVLRESLAEWRAESAAGTMMYSGERTTAPIPQAWAYFRAYGIE